MSSLIDEAQDANTIDALRADNARLLRQLDKARATQEEIVAAIYGAVRDNVRAITFKPVTKPTLSKPKKGDHDETAIICFSDLQLGQVTPTYNSIVAEARVHHYIDKVERLVALQRAHHPVRNAKLYCLGDLVEGELLFPQQPWQVDSSLFSQAVREGPRILTDAIRRLLSTFETVEVVSVPGNHGDVGGASRKNYNPETNFDRILSSVVEQTFAASGEKRAKFTIPAGYGRSSFYAVDYIGDIGFMLWHGHQARRMSNSSHLSFYKLVMGWRSGAIPEHFTVSICGHHHTPTMLTMNSVTHFINGTFASDADYAIERLAANSKAAQWLLFAKPGRGLTAQYLVDLE